MKKLDTPRDEMTTIFMCGPNKKCEHDYSGFAPIIENGKEVGGTAVCVKCGQTAFEEDMWR